MARIGTGIRPELGRIDYTPYMQGALAGSQSIAQGIATLGQIAGKSISDYYTRKEEEKKREGAANSFIKTIEANPAAFQSYLKDGKVDKDAVRSMVNDLGFEAALQLNTYLSGFAKQDKAEKLKTESAKYADYLTQTQGEDNTGASFMKNLRSFQEGQFSPEAKLAGRQMNLETRKTEAQIRELESRASGGGGEPTSAMKNAKVIADSELARGLITQDQYQGRIADIVAVGGVETFNPGGIFRRADGTGDPISTIVDARGNYYRHDAKGNRVKLNLSEYSPSSRSESNTLSPDGFRKISTDIVNQQNQINSINEFLKSTEGLSRSGLQRVVEGFTSKVKTALGLPLSEAENALGEGKARQQRLLGAIRNEILGPGVLTDQDAERLYQAMDGDIRNISTNIDRVRKALFAIVNEKNNLYKQDLDLYNYNAKEKYTFARPLDLIPLYEFSNEQAPSLQQNNPFATTRTLRIGDGKLVPVKQPTQSQYNLLDFVGR
jgi:hypothetical protein